MKFSIVYKLSLGAALLVLVSVSVTSLIFYTKTTELLVGKALDDIAKETRATGDHLKSRISNQHNDTIFLAGTPPIQGILRAQNGGGYDKKGNSGLVQWKQRLAVIFSTMLGSKEGYLKIRYIDKHGQELVVAGRTKDKIVVADKSELQNKKLRNYVKKTLKLPVKEVFLSEINLNKEFGKISEPHQEVLRTATPIYDNEKGEVAGLVVITAEIGAALRDIQLNIADKGKDVFITNDRGGYLLHKNKSKTYGFDLGKRFRVQEDIPELSELYLPENTSKGIKLEIKKGSEQYVVNFSKLFFDASNRQRFIAVGITERYSQILFEEAKLLNNVVNLVVVLAVIATLLAMLFAFRLAKPISRISAVLDGYIKQGGDIDVGMPVNRNDEIGVLARSFNSLLTKVEEAQQGLQKMNKSLEKRVIERTQRLELSELRQRSIVDNMVDGLITIDGKGTVLSFNNAAAAIFGYKASEVIGCNIKMLMPEPYHSEHDGYLSNFHKTGITKIIGSGRDVEGLRKDGGVFPIELAVNEMIMDGKKIYTGVLRDITERKQVEKAKNEFISTVSHELRTPLTAIRGALGLITGGAVGELPEKVFDMLSIAENNTRRLLFLINDILDVQKMESGQMVFKFHTVDVSKLINQAVEDNQTYAEQHDVTFSIESQLEHTYIFADKDRLMQVMANLLSNAAKFSPKGGEIKISVARHEGLIRISVTDEGPGIPDDFHEMIFEQFTQSDSSETKEKGGTGLGLAISKGIIERHQGRIDFVTSIGIGTTFYFELSELNNGQEEMVAPVEISKNHNEPCILIIEEDHDVAMLLRRMLVVEGYNADIVGNAMQAKQRLYSGDSTYKLIALDVNLPNKSGFALLDELRNKKETQELPVVVINAKAGKKKRKLDCEVLDLVDWSKRPIDVPRLIDTISKVVGKGIKRRVLHVEDEVDIQKVVNGILSDSCELTWAKSLSDARKLLAESEFDVVLLDVKLPDGSGLDLLSEINKKTTPPKVVIFSAYNIDSRYEDMVSAVLLKSTTNNSRLVEVINNVVSNHG